MKPNHALSAAPCFALRRSALKILAATAVTIGALLTATGSLGQPGYPSRPLRFIVGFPPGGTTDLVARLVGEQLAANLGQPVVIDNRPGAGGRIAAELTAKAPADGYTLMLTSGSITVAQSMHARLSYDVQRDFTHITLLVDSPFVLAAHPRLPPKSLQELIAYARTRPGQVNFASSGVGTPSHLASELLGQMAKLELTHVPYKGSSLAMTDLIAGRVQIYFTGFTGSVPHVRAGRIRPLAVTSRQRSPVLPEVATMTESGLQGYRAGSWCGLAFPRGVSPAIVKRVAALVQQSLSAGGLEAKLTEHGLEIRRNVTPEASAEFIQQDIAYWRNVIQRAGMRP